MASRPQIGSVIEVVVKRTIPAPVFVPDWNKTVSLDETMTYTGTVAKPFPWTRPDEFTMTTNIPYFPVRTIRLGSVVSINGVEGEKVEETDTRVVTVEGSKGNQYFVVIRNNVAESCSCPAFSFRKQRCKHMKSVDETNRG